MLEAARELHKYFYDAKEVLAMIQEKENLLTDDLGRDLNSLHQLQVVHQGFEADLAPLGNQVGRVHKNFRRFVHSHQGARLFPPFLHPEVMVVIERPSITTFSRLFGEKYRGSIHNTPTFFGRPCFVYSLTNRYTRLSNIFAPLKGVLQF